VPTLSSRRETAGDHLGLNRRVKQSLKASVGPVKPMHSDHRLQHMAANQETTETVRDRQESLASVPTQRR
jgi:hypothetical protein